MTREKKLSFIETYKRNTRDKKMKKTYYLMMLEQSNDKMEVSQLRTKKKCQFKNFLSTIKERRLCWAYSRLKINNSIFKRKNVSKVNLTSSKIKLWCWRNIKELQTLFWWNHRWLLSFVVHFRLSVSKSFSILVIFG